MAEQHSGAGRHEKPPAHSHSHQGDCCANKDSSAEAKPGMAKDPVCGMDVDPHTAKHRAEHAGRTYYFCSAGCRAKFIADPPRYLAKEGAPPAAVAPGAIYTCPMHPEIRQVG